LGEWSDSKLKVLVGVSSVELFDEVRKEITSALQ